MEKLPQGRDSELVVQKTDNETLLYDTKSHKALCLNKTSSLIWAHCNGNTNVKDFAKNYNLTAETIELALDGFKKHNLLKDQVESQVPTDRIARRKFMLKAGATAMALPLITMIVAPHSAAAQSGCFGPGSVPTGALPPPVTGQPFTIASCRTYCESNTNCCTPAVGSGFGVGAMSCSCSSVFCG